MPGAPLPLPERDGTAVALIEDRGVSWAGIGRRVGRHVTTMPAKSSPAEVVTGYRPATAQRRAERNRCRPRPSGPTWSRGNRAGPCRAHPRAIHAGVVRGQTGFTRPSWVGGFVVVVRLESSMWCRSATAGEVEGSRSSGTRTRAFHVLDDHVGVFDPGVGQLDGAPAQTAPGSGTGKPTGSSVCTRPVPDAEPDRAGHPLPDPGHHAQRLRRRRDGWQGLVDGLDPIPARLPASITFDQGSEW